jgi:hypothetical protein
MRSRIRRPKRRRGSSWFYATLAVIVIAGTVGIALSVGGSANDVHPMWGLNPKTGDFYDHWHEALGVNVCGEWVSAPPTFENGAGSDVRAGLHTHGDGFIHIHPFDSADAGNHATLGRFFADGGWDVAQDSFTLWAGPSSDLTKTNWSNGDTCPKGTTMAGQKGEVKWSVNCVARSGDPAQYKLQDLHVVALGFLPKGKSIGVPPNAFQTPTADSPSKASSSTPSTVKAGTCGTAGPGGTTTTTPGATTTTTAGATTTTAGATTTTTPKM